jgi:tetratricopeptide (TPR) repeat protein
MQESGPAPAVDEEADTHPSKDSAAASRPPRPRRTSDPVVRSLTLGILAVIAFWLVSVISAMIFGLLTPPKAPRTAAERDLMALTATVDSGGANTQTYSQYIGTLIGAGQLAKAQQALDQALKIAKTDKSYLYARQADLALAQKDYKGAVAAADKAMAEAEKELQAFMAENVKNNRNKYAGAKIPTSYVDAALAKADALLASKDYAGAIKAFDIYIKQSATDSDILVQRGQAKIQVGDTKGAADDFRSALKYIPDFQPALDGLKQIGAAK